MVNYIAFAVPVFGAMIAGEILWARARKASVYRLNDAVNDLSMGIGQQLIVLFTTALKLGAYAQLEQRSGLIDISVGSWIWWLIAMVGYDCIYYWFHRASHEINFLWAAHGVHHQSEEYNLAVALRQSWFQHLFSFFFFLPMALLGVPVLMFAVVAGVDLLYQFWIHTRLIDRMPRFGLVFNTPSHHRVHHGTQPEYIDRNHAGMFIIWDKIFGTFQAEKAPPIYGLVKPLDSWNPVWANVHLWVTMVRRAVATARWSDKVRVFLKGPGWRAPDEPEYTGKKTTDPGYRSYDPPLTRREQGYVVSQFSLVLLASLYLLAFFTQLPVGQQLVLSVGVLATLTTVGAVMDHRRWALGADLVRNGALVGAAFWAAPAWLALVVTGIAGASAACLIFGVGRSRPS